MAELVSTEEYWLQGPVDGVPALLQPVAHALMQARKEIDEVLGDFDDKNLWHRPKQLASVGFHLKHIVGVLDRLFTYARGEVLSTGQLEYLSNEGLEIAGETSSGLVLQLSSQVNQSIEYLKTVDVTTLTDPRTVGRKKLPSTVIGLLFHSAEHTMRHCGQLRVTAKVSQKEPE